MTGTMEKEIKTLIEDAIRDWIWEGSDEDHISQTDIEELSETLITIIQKRWLADRQSLETQLEQSEQRSTHYETEYERQKSEIETLKGQLQKCRHDREVCEGVMDERVGQMMELKVEIERLKSQSLTPADAREIIETLEDKAAGSEDEIDEAVNSGIRIGINAINDVLPHPKGRGISSRYR
jgi:chromosome segregation ATPase